eukprot:TRINITY_DN1368_c0_g1_i1.p1 TRINITY_DN1368_c0_g1~~TRINITY_DN1368_c0_g1_i1.p1  ORF type:complete len:248 (-),score=103.43 TRINITY_DN1368_c0_g1_i1:174-917(-)
MQSYYKDYYQILGVPKSASQKQIDKAYCKLSSQWHPSNHEDNYEEANKRFQDISEAYSVLSNKSKRAQYDKKLKCKGQPKSREESPHSSSDNLFKIFFGDWSPFLGLGSDFFGGELFEPKKREIQAHRKSSQGEDTIHSDEEESPKEECVRHLYSTSSSTVIKNGERVTKTKKTMIGPDGSKKVKIIEEKEDKEGNVNRTVKCLKNGKEVKNYQKQITAGGEEQPELKKSKSLSQMDKSKSKYRAYP